MTHSIARTPAITKKALRASVTRVWASPSEMLHWPRVPVRWPAGGVIRPPGVPMLVMPRRLSTPWWQVNRIRSQGIVPRSCGLADLDGAFGQAEPEAVDDGACPGQFAGGGAERDEQRGEVLGARMGQPRGRRLVLEVKQRIDVPVGEHLLSPVIELRHHRGNRAAGGHRAQVVGEEAAADDEDP